MTALAQGPDRSLWVGMAWTGKGRGLQQFRDGIWKPLFESGLDSSTLSVLALLLDRDGGLWVGTVNQGIYHIHGSHVDRFARKTASPRTRSRVSMRTAKAGFGLLRREVLRVSIDRKLSHFQRVKDSALITWCLSLSLRTTRFGLPMAIAWTR